MSGRLPRATTPQQKDERKRSILVAANEHLVAVGLEAFSMEVLAKELGYARGTLYRYFGTREEVLLNLYHMRRASWVQRLQQVIKPDMADRVFVRRHYAESVRDPLFLTLRARLESVIIPNVSAAKLVESRELTMDSMRTLAGHYAACLALSDADARRLIIAYGALTLGAALVETHAARQGQPLADGHLTKDMRALVKDMSAQKIFESNALMILEGLRRRCKK